MLTKRKRTQAKRGCLIANSHAEKGDIDTFDVLVLAPMSAGKTAFVNALIGYELLPSANTATTASLISIKHAPNTQGFTGICYNHDGLESFKQQDTDASLIREWNADPLVKRIHLTGRFRTKAQLISGLVLHDTPGPNNSTESRHSDLAKEALSTIPFKALCYILDSGYLGTKDDRALLMEVRQQLNQHSEHQVIFVLNKADLLDSEKGESISCHVDNARNYLKGLGFLQPIIIPMIANVVVYAWKELHKESLSRQERLSLHNALCNLDDYRETLLNAARIPVWVKRGVRSDLDTRFPPHANGDNNHGYNSFHFQEGALHQLIDCSGIKVVETILGKLRLKILKRFNARIIA